MLTKNVDQVIIGKSTFSLLLGLQLLQKGSTILLLDDDRVGYGDLYERFLGQIVVHSLKNWGEELAIEPLTTLENYLTPSHEVFHVPYQGATRRVFLGPSVWSNMLELTRKLGRPADAASMPAREGFDEQVGGALARLGRDMYRFQSLSQLDAKNLTSHFPPALIAWAQPIVAPFLGRKKLDLARPWDAFFYLARAVYHQKFSLDFSSTEVWHLLLEAIIPRFELDRHTLINDLVNIYQLRGGQFKATRVREWMFYKSSPWSLELSSYEGIIHPKKLVVMGSYCADIGLEVEPEISSYASVQITFEGQSCPIGQRHFMFSPDEVGTDFGLWSVASDEAGLSHIDVAVRRRPGMKIDFYIQSLLERSERLLSHTFPLNPVEYNPQHAPRLGREMWIDEHFHRPSRLKGELLLSSPIKLRQVRAPGDSEIVKNVSYFGPARRDRLGLVSSLLEMKDSLPRLQ